MFNRGPNPATGIEVTENLPAGLDFVSASESQGAYDPATGTWSVGSLAVGEIAQLVLAAQVAAPDALTDVAVKTGQNEPDPITSNDSAAAVTTTPAADLAVDNDVDRRVLLVGETVTFMVRATNRGPSQATGITIADALPAGLSFVSDAPSLGWYDPATGIWTVGTLDWLAEATLTLVAQRVDQPDALVNHAAMASQDQVDPNPFNNTAAVSVNARPAADLRVAKAVSNPAPGVGALVTYTVAATNLGPDDTTSADVSDVLPAGVAFVSASASQGSYDAGTGIWTLGAMPATATEILTVTARVTARAP